MKKYLKYIILSIVIIIIIILGFFIYEKIFADSISLRFKDIENYKITNEEKNNVKDKINELDNIENIDVYTGSKIIKIVVKLEEDIDFENVKIKANEIINFFSEENLSYYDLEFFVESATEESEVYPQIGYKFKSSFEFVW